MADAVINENVAVCYNAFWRAIVSVLPSFGKATEPNDYGLAATANKLLQYFVWNRQHRELQREVQLSAQYMEHYGWTALHPRWSREIRLKRFDVDIETFIGAAAQAPEGSPLRALPALLLDASREAQALPLMRELYGLYVRSNMDGLNDAELPELTDGRVRQAIRDIREHGKAKIPLPYLHRNQPVIEAMKPWEEVILTDDLTDEQEGRVFFRYWLTESELRSRGRAEGWDETWIEEAAKLKGRYTDWTANPQNASYHLEDWNHCTNEPYNGS
jgi:hypothetical protein